MLKNIDIEKDIIEKPTDDVRELLIEQNLNSQELRELVYRLATTAHGYKNSYLREKARIEDLQGAFHDGYEDIQAALAGLKIASGRRGEFLNVE